MPAFSAIQGPTDRNEAQGKTPCERRPLDRLSRYLTTLSDGGFFGKVVVSFQNGKVHDVKVEQTLKLDDL